MEHRKRTRLLVEDTHSLPNLLFTICDDDADDDDVGMDDVVEDAEEDESHEYLIGSNEFAAHIKTEQETQTLPVQYRIVSNQLQRHHHHHHHMHHMQAAETTTTTTTTLLPTAVQLPSGCEIYLVKEYVEPVVTTSLPRIVATTSGGGGGGGSGAGGGIGSNAIYGSTVGIGNMELLCGNIATVPSTTVTRTIKLEPRIASSSHNSNISQRCHSTELNASTTTTSAAAAARNGLHVVRKVTTSNASTSTVAAGTATVNSGKRSYILETYKKRDDKRRATHNEVERRRRDKINSWIFKLKEMLPADNGNCMKITNSNNSNTNNNSNSTLVAQQKATQSSVATASSASASSSSNNNNNNSNNNNRTTSDSKSQILIKACDYIKTMQDEINSLRECLTENANLRSCNQRLENELNKLKAAYIKLNSNNIYNSSSSNNNTINKYNLTLNSLNNNHSNHHHHNNINNNNSSNIFVSANNALEILPVVAEFDSALLLAAATSSNNNGNNISTSNPTLTYATAKHELILNDLNI